MTNLHPYCNVCGWRKGGRDSWNGTTCKCGDSAPMIRLVDAQPIPAEARAGRVAKEQAS